MHRFKDSCLTIAVFALLSTLSTERATADQTFRVCMGEDQANGCPVSKDAMFGCGVSPDAAAQSVCAVTRDGQKTVPGYRTVHEGSHDGGRCGYEWYRVTCLDK
jgi:hypothetical protein